MVNNLLKQAKTTPLTLGIAVLTLLLGGFFSVKALAPKPAPADFPNYSLATQPQENQEAIAQADSSASSSESSQLTVDVKGAVAKEGIYELPAGSRVNDAIKLAGGLLDTADRKSINLAQKLTDEAVVYVANQGENNSVITGQPTGTAAGQGTNASGKVNLNTADQAQLQTITGIGAKKAKDIIAYRESNGGFQSVDDLNNISGIGDKTLAKIREEVTVD